MKRSPDETARALIRLQYEVSGGERYCVCRLTWPDLRMLAGVAKLNASYLSDLVHTLNSFGYTLTQLSDSVVIDQEHHYYWQREFVSADIISKYLPDRSHRSRTQLTSGSRRENVMNEKNVGTSEYKLGKLKDLKVANRVGREVAVLWLKAHLPEMTQEDLLAGFGFGCPCGACHKSKYELFRDVFRVVGKEEFREILKELLLKHPENINLPETAFILLYWLQEHDIQNYLKPFCAVDPRTGLNHLDSIDGKPREHMVKHSEFKCAISEMEVIVKALVEVGINEKQLVDYQAHCHTKWLAQYKPQMLSAKHRKREDTFEKRYHAFMHGSIKSTQHYFDLNSDRELLKDRLFRPEQRHLIPEIVRHLPTKKGNNWCKFGKQLMKAYEAAGQLAGGANL